MIVIFTVHRCQRACNQWWEGMIHKRALLIWFIEDELTCMMNYLVFPQREVQSWPCLWNGIQKPCYLFARKFTPETLDTLLRLFSNYSAPWACYFDLFFGRKLLLSAPSWFLIWHETCKLQHYWGLIACQPHILSARWTGHGVRVA